MAGRSRRGGGRVGWLAAGLSAVYLVVDWLVPGSIALGPGLPSVRNPTGLRALSHVPHSGPLANGIWVLGLACLLVTAVGVVLRYRRSADEERLQLKWFA